LGIINILFTLIKMGTNISPEVDHMDQMRVQNIAVKYVYLGEQPIAGEKYYHKYMV